MVVQLFNIQLVSFFSSLYHLVTCEQCANLYAEVAQHAHGLGKLNVGTNHRIPLRASRKKDVPSTPSTSVCLSRNFLHNLIFLITSKFQSSKINHDTTPSEPQLSRPARPSDRSSDSANGAYGPAATHSPSFDAKRTGLVRDRSTSPRRNHRPGFYTASALQCTPGAASQGSKGLAARGRRASGAATRRRRAPRVSRGRQHGAARTR